MRDVLEERVVPGDPVALAEGILGFLALDAEARQDKADALRQRLIERFDWESVAKGYARSLAVVAGRNER